MKKDPFALSSYQYHLPEELIAQYPCTPRDNSRLMIIKKSTGEISEVVFHELKDFLKKDDSLVFNDTKVFPARLIGNRESGGKAEIFLTRQISHDTWEALVKPGRKLPKGSRVVFGEELNCEIREIFSDGTREVRFNFHGDFQKLLMKYARIPLPLYIRREPEDHIDIERYQTVFAENTGSVAAPTAGLHFTPELLEDLSNKGVGQNKVTLHVGIGTFRPVKTEDIRHHCMHTEKIIITPETAQKLNTRPENGRQICVGTTCCRSVESANHNGLIVPGIHETNIFIYPGYQFQYVRNLLTNFHLSGSTLLMLTCAFGGYELVMEAYAKAVKEKFRFFSYGDAMLILE